jgi:sirohydrochlorin ferrochelatase
MLIGTIVAVAFLVCLPATVRAQEDAAARRGTLVVAHGAGADWNAQVEAVVREVRTGGPVEISYLMGPAAATHRFQDRVLALIERGAREIVVVPLLMSSHSGHYEQLRYLAGDVDTLSAGMLHHLHMSGITRPDVDVPVRLANAIDGAPELLPVLIDRARALSTSTAEEAVLLIGHGPNSAEDHARWMAPLRVLADSLRARGGFRDVKVGLLRDDAPPQVRAEAVHAIRDVIALQHQVTGRPVLVVPLLISSGQLTEVKIPADLDGLPIRYTGEALLPHSGLARWIEVRSRSSDSPR